MLAMVTVFTVLFSVNAYAGIDANALNNEMLSNINELRATQGAGPLKMDSSLISVANIRSKEASVEWSHTRPNGQQGVEMIAGNKWKGENLSNVSKADDVTEAAEYMFDNLVASPTHYDNMVFGDFTKIGISSYIKDGTITVAYMFSS